MFVIGFIGTAGVGKTTVASGVIEELSSRGWRVAAVKSSHHDVLTDCTGKDTDRMRQAGAREVALAANNGLTLFVPQTTHPTIEDVISRFHDPQIVIVEGYRHEGVFPRIWVKRKGWEEPLDARIAQQVVAVADDGFTTLPKGTCRLKLADCIQIADFIEQLAQQRINQS